MRILLVNDSALIRRGVRAILADEFPEADVGEAPDVAAGAELVRTERWDVVILDPAMPGGGLDLLHELKTLRPGLALLALSLRDEEQFVLAALKAGAAGYVTEDRAPDELVPAVKELLAGGRYLSGDLAGRLGSELRGDEGKAGS